MLAHAKQSEAKTKSPCPTKIQTLSENHFESVKHRLAGLSSQNIAISDANFFATVELISKAAFADASVKKGIVTGIATNIFRRGTPRQFHNLAALVS